MKREKCKCNKQPAKAQHTAPRRAPVWDTTKTPPGFYCKNCGKFIGYHL